MKVYVVLWNNYGEHGADFLGTYSSHAKAEEYVKSHAKNIIENFSKNIYRFSIAMRNDKLSNCGVRSNMKFSELPKSIQRLFPNAEKLSADFKYYVRSIKGVERYYVHFKGETTRFVYKDGSWTAEKTW